MKIKRLTILGFKSFLDRCNISFPDGISGIVGPNGCGKSNIVDAIRWCMGEQSPKQLRGRNMEDVIFSGSGGHKPLGMAEVTLTFENGDGSFPPSFSGQTELSVTRRLYRSGESEYLINNVPCRLKDIQEIFMDTGLGNKAYSIIGQGMIGSILEQRPEDTRIMLEEAAGITKYRKKVEASRRKMERTEQNLQRVEDIQGEVARQMRSLKRQAAKARRYNALTEEIRRLELVLNGNRYRLLEEESRKKIRNTEALEQREAQKAAAYSSVAAQVETLGLELEEKDRELSKAREAYEHLRSRVQAKESAIESQAVEMKLQEEITERLVQERRSIGRRLESLGEEKQGLGARIAEGRDKLRHMEREASVLDQRVRSRRKLLLQVKEEYEKARNAVNEGVNKEVGLNHESGYLNKLLHQITDTRSRLERERLAARQRAEKVLKAYENKGSARDLAAEKLHDLEERIAEVGSLCEEQESLRDRAAADLRAAEKELDVNESRYGSLKSLTKNFEGYEMGVRTVMKSNDLAPKQQGRVLGLVADIVRVEPRYEQAVEAVLADKLQYIIVESMDDGRAGIDYLKSKARGRGSFIPLRELNREGNGGPPQGQRLLRELVTVPEKYESVLEALLGDTVVVDHLDEAVALWRRNGKEQSIVTLEGDLLDRRGIITGGKVSRSSRGILARKRELKELKEQIETGRRKVARCRETLAELIGEIEEKKAELRDLDEEKWACREELNELDKITYRFGQELDQLEQLSRRIEEDLAEKDREQGKHRKKLRMLEEEIERCRVRRKDEEAFFREKERELRECEGEFEEAREELSRLKADARILEEEQRSLARELERIQEYEEDAALRLKRIEEEIAEAARRREACDERKAQLRNERLALEGRLSDALEALHRSERERQELQGKIKEKEKEAETLRAEIDAVREEVNRARMEQSELRFKMNHIVELVREKFGQDLLQVIDTCRDESRTPAELEAEIQRQTERRQKLGEVNLTAIKEHEALKERYEFISEQRRDLIDSIESLRKAIRKINQTSLEKFRKTFSEVDAKLKEVFPVLFNGGTAGLRLTDESKPLESGVLVEVQPPGKRVSHMGLLSGGEKALVAMALLFAIYMIRPSPFCLLDEVDAPLDEANVGRFNDLLKQIRRHSQIIMVTHNRRTMEISDRLYGITMEKAGVSKIVSVDVSKYENTKPQDPRLN